MLDHKTFFLCVWRHSHVTLRVCNHFPYNEQLLDDQVVDDTQGPVVFIQENNGPARGLAHIRTLWDEYLHGTVYSSANSIVGSGDCLNGRRAGDPECLPWGYIRHLGPKFQPATDGLPVAAQPEIVGLAGGYGWLLTLNEGAPKKINITQIEVSPETPLMLSIQYPIGVSVTVTAHAVSWCRESCSRSCTEVFTPVASVDQVRASEGNVYHHDAYTGLLTIRVIQMPEYSTGAPYWKLFDYDDVDYYGEALLRRFERKGVLLPQAPHSQAHISIQANNCVAGGTNNAYCQEAVAANTSFDNVCSLGYVQHSYDRCCDPNDHTICEYPQGVTTPAAAPTLSPGPTANDHSILENGDLEAGVWCPWDVCCGASVELNRTEVYEGTASVQVSNRNYYWQGLSQNVFGKLQLNELYRFEGHIYILNANIDNGVGASIAITYAETSGCNTQYPSIYFASNVVGGAWHNMTSEFNLSPSPGCTVSDLRFYLQSSNGQLYDYLFDDLSIVHHSDIFA